jgi:cell division protein FtsQ
MGAARVGERRWTLFLDNGIKVALPEYGVPAALSMLSRLEREQALLEKGIVAIDLRLAGRVVIEPAAVAEESKPKLPLRVSVQQ